MKNSLSPEERRQKEKEALLRELDKIDRQMDQRSGEAILAIIFLSGILIATICIFLFMECH